MPFLARNQHTRTGPRETAHPLLHIDTKRQRWEAGQMSDALANILLQRNRIVKTGAARMGCSGQKAIIRWMPAIHIRMRDTAEHSEVVPMFRKRFQVGRQRVVAATILRKELIRQQSEVVADAKHSAGFSARRRSRSERPLGRAKRGRHGVQ